MAPKEEKDKKKVEERIKRYNPVQDEEHLAKQMNELNNLNTYCFIHHSHSPCQYCVNED